MKQVNVVCLVIALIGLMTSSTLWARGGGGYGGGGHYGGGYSGGRGYGGGHYGGRYAGGGWGYGRGNYYGRSNFGFYFGAPFYPYYSNPYPYYPPAIITVPVTPPVYIQQQPPPPAAQQYPAGYWYYCTNPEGYYPYVKACATGWQQVNPIPPAPR